MKEKELFKAKEKNIKENNRILKENNDIVEIYNSYVYKIVELFDYLKKDKTDLFYTIVFDILTDLGFFSIDQKFIRKIDSPFEIKQKPGINIMLGNGYCRNIACFYNDVFSKFYNYPLTMVCHDNNDLEGRKFGNHMINLTFYHDTLYAFDLINHLLFYFITKNKLQEFNGNSYLYYKKYGDILMRIVTDTQIKNDYIEKIENKKNLFKIASRKEKITTIEYQKLINEANQFIMDKQKIFQSFLWDTEDLRDEMKEKVLLKK